MEITVNGKKEDVQQCSILEFIRQKGLKPEVVVVEYNLNIIKRENWAETRIAENDNLEILSFVGGG
ncbi:MAG: sulfur carrier protein ThiS [Desulfobacterales bacterium]|nr:sulfur carrier protein ThiS [Desulfobacterales bacterium]